MKTDRLIDFLADNLAPAGGRTVLRTLMIGLGAGALVSFAVVVFALGIRPDFAAAAHSWPLWMKFLYTLAFAAAALGTAERLSRPGAAAGRRAALAAVPFALVAILGLGQWLAAPAAEHMHLLLGHSFLVCPWIIVGVSLPVFAGLVTSMRRLAPTRPMLAGAAAGLAAGATGAFLYAFHCDESAATFVAVWYTSGIALVGLLGALIGRWALRW